MDLALLTEKAELTTTGLYASLTKPALLYHNVDHTRDVVSACRIIGDAIGLSEEDRAVLVVSAWWHDVGYLFGGPVNHEERSAEKAAEFLQAAGVPPSFIQKVRGCIMATKMPQSPETELERILCDADLYHLGTVNFKPYTKKIRKEAELYGAKPISGSEWRESTITLLRSHRYHTEYARAALEAGQAQNLGGLLQKQEEKELEKDKPSAAIVSMHTDLTPGGQKEEVKEEKEEKKKKVKDDKPSRGIETMFRITSTNHIRLSAMADSKANIMISVNSIIISVVLSMLVRKIEDYPHLVLPTIVLLVVNVSAIIFSVLATRPNITKGTFTHEDVKMKRVNLLFFGNFHKMGLGDYEMGVKAMMGDNDYLYSGMIRDIYFLGVVLGKKYRLLRISYTIFMFGIVLAILAFAASIYMFKGK
jgi:predicted metal-dependent HD superfamily phosphohydrolase